MNSFIELKVHSIASRLLQNYLRQSYEYFVNKKRSEISSSILSQSNHVVDNAFRPGLMVLSNMIVLISIVDNSVISKSNGYYSVWFVNIVGLLANF